VLACLLLAVYLNPSLRGAEADPVSPPAKKDETNAELAKWEALVAKKLKLPLPPTDAVIGIGSSHMALWKTMEADLAPLRVVNMGIGGSRMKHAADLFVQKLAIPFKPRAVLLYEGSNDLAGGAAPSDVLKDFQRLYSQLHSELPETRLYVLGIVPSPGKRFERWEAIQETNALLRSECRDHPWMRFIDTTSPLLNEQGKPRQECFIPNDVHMTEAGYEVWKAAIAPVLIPAETPAQNGAESAPN
jgi:lysophospholipase L1-like esterase